MERKAVVPVSAYNPANCQEVVMKRVLSAALLTVVATGVWIGISVAQTSQSAACGPSGGLNFICGLQAAEDLVLVPGTRWLIASGMAPGSGLHLIDTQAKTAKNFFSSDVS